MPVYYFRPFHHHVLKQALALHSSLRLCSSLARWLSDTYLGIWHLLNLRGLVKSMLSISTILHIAC